MKHDKLTVKQATHDLNINIMVNLNRGLGSIPRRQVEKLYSGSLFIRDVETDLKTSLIKYI